jgi:hypothetical protein
MLGITNWSIKKYFLLSNYKCAGEYDEQRKKSLKYLFLSTNIGPKPNIFDVLNLYPGEI